MSCPKDQRHRDSMSGKVSPESVKPFLAMSAHLGGSHQPRHYGSGWCLMQNMEAKTHHSIIM